MHKIHQRKKNTMSKDWKSRFFDPTIQWVYAASNASSRAIAVSNVSGKFQLHAHDFETGYNRQITRKRSGMLFGSISPDGKNIYYLNDATGNEHGHFVRTPFTGGKTVDITPDLPPYFSYTLAISDAGDYFSFTSAFKQENKVYTFSQSVAPTCIYTSEHSISEPIISGNGLYTCIAVVGEKKDGWSECIIINNITNAVYARKLFKGDITPIAFSRHMNKPTVCVLSNELGCTYPVLWQYEEKQTITVQNAKFHGDVFVLAWNEKNQELLVCDVSAAQHHLYIYNTSSEHVKPVGPTDGSFDLFFGSAISQKDGSFLVRWSNFNTPSQYLKIHAPKYNKWDAVYTPSKFTSTTYLIENIKFRSSDNSRIQAWVVCPKNIKKPTPFIIDIHGGPHGVSSNEYRPEIQAWLESGFGYCTVNYRGSIGFGKEFQKKIYGNPGYWEVEDVVAARNYLVKKRLADHSRILVTGWSWGGYVTLFALCKYPLLWMAGVAAASVTDCVMQYEDEPVYFKATDEQIFKGSPKTNYEQYIKSSPVTYLQDIKAPILLLHGKNDVRCPPRQIKNFVNLMHKAKKKIEVVWYSSGHTGDYTDIPLRVKLLKKTISFAVKYKNIPPQE